MRTVRMAMAGGLAAPGEAGKPAGGWPGGLAGDQIVQCGGRSSGSRRRTARQHSIDVLSAATAVTMISQPIDMQTRLLYFSADSSMSFRVLHFSVQMDHVHLLLEADASVDLRRGIQ